MKRKNILDTVCYENCILKTRYNDLIKYIAKLEQDNKNLVQALSSKSTTIRQNKVTQKPAGTSRSMDCSSGTTTQLFQISKYCSSVNNTPTFNDRSDTVSELTM